VRARHARGRLPSELPSAMGGIRGGIQGTCLTIHVFRAAPVPDAAAKSNNSPGAPATAAAVPAAAVRAEVRARARATAPHCTRCFVTLEERIFHLSSLTKSLLSLRERLHAPIRIALPPCCGHTLNCTVLRAPAARGTRARQWMNPKEAELEVRTALQAWLQGAVSLARTAHARAPLVPPHRPELILFV
jgi:hypothetical protein